MSAKGYRPNVAALVKCGDRYVACLRTKHPGWQCVQGGIDLADESPEHAIVREMREELGVASQHMTIEYRARYWRRYNFISNPKPYVGQEQLWFVVSIPSVGVIDLTIACNEFSEIRLMNIGELVDNYVKWKNQPFYDFCRELQLI